MLPVVLPAVVKVSRLRREGWVRRDVEALVSGGYRRIGDGWLAGPGAPPAVVGALRVGARLTCVSAAPLHGLWTPPSVGVHVFRRMGSPARTGELAHHPRPRSWPDDEPVADLPLLLEHAVDCLTVPEAAILFESARNQGLLTGAGTTDVLSRVPERARRSLVRVQASAQSGTETRVRWWLESRRVPVRAQERIARVGLVDLLVGRSWVIECDSAAHHTSAQSYADDRRRDLELARRGYRVTRLTWEQVFLFWDRTEQALQEILDLGHHRRDVTPGTG